MLIGTLLFGYSTNSVGILINRIDSRGKGLTENLTIIDDFMNKSSLNENLKIKVKQYFNIFGIQRIKISKNKRKFSINYQLK